ncbi:MAG: hypothetical protein ACTSVD_05185 [Candidatus Thorarchaeota archaeon]|nr:MAG: hypothetical protein DRO73_09260 [Candidatus Thorarchaeota archaeon]RLI59130.1 MAG: hypothetical protein DRO93_08830 [Candidatus Thorarchaeota archaeon]
MAGLTKGMIVDIRNKREVRIPDEFYNSPLYKDVRAAIAIYFERTGEIRIIPMSREGGARVRLEVEKVNPALMQTMTHLFKQHDLKVLYTTGFCFEQNRCIYEVYFATDNIREKEPHIRQIIESIPGLYESEFEILEIGKEW